ncbi:MAG: helicase-associated domain-containing protein [Candidatus Thorarchaeota archaeon]|nr:helicase-associated domain-containing protein [Candidatus Thorarchaeota archaeon]
MAKETLEKELDHIFREDLLFACQYWGIDVSGSTSGTQLTQLLAKRMKTKEARDRIFATFGEAEADLLGILTLNDGAMSYDRLKPFRKIYSYGQLNQTERDLRKKGIIIRRMMSRLTEYGREVAEFKILEFFLPHLKKYFSNKPNLTLEKPKKAKNIVNDRDTLLIDTLLLTSYLAKNEVKMTSSWEFPKREIDHIKTAMSESTDDRFELVQRIARKAAAYEIVDKDRVTPGRVHTLYAGKQDVVSKRILLSAVGRTRAIWATPDQPTEYTLNLVICRLRESNSEEWISVPEMRQWIRSELFIDGQPLKWIQITEERVGLALETPILLGLVEGAYKGKNLLGVRLTNVGESVITGKQMDFVEGQESFIVLPNFEVTVFTAEMDYYKLYQLMLIAEPVRTDVVSTFRLTEASIFNAVELGFRENDIIEFLEAESSKPIPTNVKRSIKDWTSQTTFASVSEVTLFETESEKELEDLLMIPEVNKYVDKRVGPAAAVILGDIDEFIEAMQEYKCHCTKLGPKILEEEPTQVSSVAEQVLMYGDQAASDVHEDCLGCPAIMSCNRVIKRKADAPRGEK